MLGLVVYVCFIHNKTNTTKEKLVKGTQRHFTSGKIQEKTASK